MTKHYIYQTADTAMYDKLKQYAKENKMFLTDAERALWTILKSKSLGYKFRQQHIIGDYIADFVSLHYHLIIEIDGKYHFKGDQPINDQLRTNDLNRMGYQVLRVTNDEVLHSPYQVVNKIKRAIMNKESLPRPLKKEESTSLTSQNNPEKNAASLVSPPFPKWNATLGLLMQPVREIQGQWNTRPLTCRQGRGCFISVPCMVQTTLENSLLSSMPWLYSTNRAIKKK